MVGRRKRELFDVLHVLSSRPKDMNPERHKALSELLLWKDSCVGLQEHMDKCDFSTLVEMLDANICVRMQDYPWRWLFWGWCEAV